MYGVIIHSMDIQRLYSYVRKAIDDYGMIKEGDRIALGISGGKDSLALLYALSGLRRFYPNKFELCAITVDLGYDNYDLTEIEELCRNLDVDYYIVKTKINEMNKDGECSLCSRLRKGALLSEAKNHNCNKIAYAHNMDDVVETMLMSLIYEGRFCSFWPVTHFEDSNIDIIRPLVYAPVEDIIGFSNKYRLPIKKNPCPFDGITKRAYIRELIKDINKKEPGVKKRLMTAVVNSDEWRIKRLNNELV